MIEKALGQQKCVYGVVGKTIKICITFVLVTFAWIFFRMPTLNDALNFVRQIVDLDLASPLYIVNKDFIFIMLGLCLLSFKDISDEFFLNKYSLMNSSNIVIRWLSYLSLILLIILAGVFEAGTFIYANF